VGVVAEDGVRQAQALRGEDLVAAQLVARLEDRIGRIGRIRTHQLELAQHRRAVARDRGADARAHRLVTGARLALVVHGEAVHRDADVTAQRIGHAYGVAAL